MSPPAGDFPQLARGAGEPTADRDLAQRAHELDAQVVAGAQEPQILVGDAGAEAQLVGRALIGRRAVDDRGLVAAYAERIANGFFNTLAAGSGVDRLISSGKGNDVYLPIAAASAVRPPWRSASACR
jgi:hypothetical protein